jgi:hypothetical protein
MLTKIQSKEFRDECHDDDDKIKTETQLSAALQGLKVAVEAYRI